MFAAAVHSSSSAFHTLIHPFTAFMICDFYMDAEMAWSCPEIVPFRSGVPVPDDVSTIPDFAVVAVQVNLVPRFANVVLPKLRAARKRIVLITSQLNLPQLARSSDTDAMLDDPTIALWASQNPVYADHPKYMAFPFGFMPSSQWGPLGVCALQTYLRTAVTAPKLAGCGLAQSGCHPHLKPDHIRRVHKQLLCDHPKQDSSAFWRQVAATEFFISPSGDRDDCYRHYECIALGTVPVANISKTLYGAIFGDSMVYVTDVELVAAASARALDGIEYTLPNRDIVTLEFWRMELQRRIRAVAEI